MEGPLLFQPKSRGRARAADRVGIHVPGVGLSGMDQRVADHAPKLVLHCVGYPGPNPHRTLHELRRDKGARANGREADGQRERPEPCRGKGTRANGVETGGQRQPFKRRGRKGRRRDMDDGDAL